MTTRLKNYRQAVDYLNSFICYEKTPPPKYEGRHYELERFNRLLQAIGHPERHLKCIHLAGTDGKGSTAAFIAKLLQSQGLKVGLYTSPHLFEYTERIQINGKPIPKKHFTGLLDELSSKLEQIQQPEKDTDLTFFATVFELLTAGAFQYFHQNKTDWAVIETGLGGRLDATNVILPEVSVITPIDREHTRLLGRTLKKIAGEKAGIIKPGRPVFCAPQKPSAREVIAQKARSCGSPLFLFDREIRPYSIQPGQRGYRFKLHSRQGRGVEIKSPLAGRQQARNLAMALWVTSWVLDGCPPEARLPEADYLEQTEKNLEGFSWPLRTEIIQKDTQVWVLDSAHSPQAARSLRRTLDELYPARPVHFSLGFSGDKNIGKFIRCLVRQKDRISCHRSSHPRSMSVELLRGRVPEELKSQVNPNVTLENLIQRKAGREILCATGSLFWAADVKEALTRQD